MVKKNTCVFISGKGTNLKNLINRSRDNTFPINIKLIITNNKNARGILFAKINSIPYMIINSRLRKNISEILGSDLFPRLRFGIGNDFPKGYQTDYVLGKWDDDQQVNIDENINKAKEIIFSFCTIGIDMTMNNLN